MNFKKIVLMAIAAAMMTAPLAGCGGNSDVEDVDTEEDVVAEEGAVQDGVSDETFEALQSQYSALVELYNIIKDAHESGTVTLDDSQLEVFNEAADVINEMGELEQGDFASEDDAVELSEIIAELAEGIGAIYDAAAESGELDLSSEGITDRTFASVQESYSALVELYNAVKESIESGALTVTTEQTDAVNQVADLINEMGELEQSDFASEQDAIEILEVIGELADALGSVAE